MIYLIVSSSVAGKAVEWYTADQELALSYALHYNSKPENKFCFMKVVEVAELIQG